eukprot:scaffold2655_cov179-Amphora_coffeaeformis.AAC.19
MSFHFSLSSDDEEEDLEEWNRREHDSIADDERVDSSLPTLGFASAAAGASTAASFGTFAATGGISLENDFDKKIEYEDDSDSDSIDWEDTHVPAQQDACKPAAVDNDGPAVDGSQTSLQPVTVDFNNDDEGEPVKKKQKTRSRKRFLADTLPQDLQSLLQNLHRAHLLSLASRAFHISKQAIDPQLLATGLSILPDDLHRSMTHLSPDDEDFVIPSLAEVKRLCHEWYFPLIQQARMRRQARFRINRAAGAPVYRQRRSRRGQHQRDRQSKSASRNEMEPPELSPIPTGYSATTSRLLSYAQYLSHSVSNDPRFGEEPPELEKTRWDALDQNQLLLSILASLGWRTRFVLAIDPVKCDLDVNHPLLECTRNIFQRLVAKRTKGQAAAAATPDLNEETSKPAADRQTQLGWIEILCKDSRQPNKLRWIHLDPFHQLVNQPDQVEILLKDVIHTDSNVRKAAVLAYAVAVEHFKRGAKFTDVTPRYAHSFVASLRHRGLLRGRGAKKQLSHEELRKTWWGKTIQKLNEHFFQRAENHTRAKLQSQGTTQYDAIAIDCSNDEKKPAASKDLFGKADEAEMEELKESSLNEAIPTSKAAFQTHPVYVIKSVLGNAEVLDPDASKRVCGMFKGQMIYRRSDVSTAYPARKWPYLGRKVRQSELGKPVKCVKARKKPASKNFKALKTYGVGKSNDGSEQQRLQEIQDASQPLDNGMDQLYAKWQTDPWSPVPVAPTDPIPINEHKNVELELLNPGLVHIDVRGIAKVAKKLGVPYAPCMLGFEGQGGNRVPTVRGIVVHAHNAQLLREAGVEVTSHAIEQEHHNRRRLVYGRWKKMLAGLLIKDRLEREYGNA